MSGSEAFFAKELGEAVTQARQRAIGYNQPEERIGDDIPVQFHAVPPPQPPRPRVVQDFTVPVWAINYRLDTVFRLIFLDLKIVIMIPIYIFGILVDMFLFLLSLVNYLFLALIIIGIFWYLAVIFWKYTVLLFLDVVIPATNVIIVLFNFFANVALIILRIVILIWDMLVPFLGMIITTVINIITSIMDDIFNILGSINWEPIISALMKILTILVDIAMQILLVLIKVGAEILIDLAKVVSFLIEVIMDVVQVLLPIVVWLLEVVYYVLQPILFILQLFFGGGSPPNPSSVPSAMASKYMAGRSLLSLTLSDAYFEKVPMAAPINEVDTDESEQDYAAFVKETLGISHENDDYIYNLYNRAKQQQQNGRTIPQRSPLPTTTPTSIPPSEFAAQDVGRRILQSWNIDKPAGQRLRFINEEHDRETAEDPHADETAKMPHAHLDDLTHGMTRTMFSHAKTMNEGTLNMAHETINDILAHHKRRGHSVSRSVLTEFAKEYGHLHPKFEDTAAAAKFTATPEHPQQMHARFYEERQNLQRNFVMGSGRKLLSEEEKTNWHDRKEQLLSQKKVDHAREISKQEAAYRNFQKDVMKVGTVFYGATTRALKTSIDDGVNPQNLMAHWNTALNAMGYESLQDIHNDFKARYGNAKGFINALTNSAVDDHPILKHFKPARPEKREAAPYAPGWESAKHGGRQLLQLNNNEFQPANVAGAKQSKEAGSSFPIFSNLNCFSPPYNPLCIPQIPYSFVVHIPKIVLTQEQKDTISSDVALCEPWEETYCIICGKRIVNFIQDIRFLISAIPPVNYAIATVTVWAPWTSPFLNWIFLVPKFQHATLFQWVCFVNHLFDAYIILIVLFFILKLLWVIMPAFWATWANIQAARITMERSPEATQRLRMIDTYLRAMQNQRVAAHPTGIGSPIGSPIGSSITINQQFNNNIVQQSQQQAHAHYHAHHDYLDRRHKRDTTQEERLQMLLRAWNDGHFNLASDITSDDTRVAHIDRYLTAVVSDLDDEAPRAARSTD